MAKRARALLLAFALTLWLFTGISPASAATPTLKEGTDSAAVLFDPLAVSKIELSRVPGGPALTFDYLNVPNYQHADVKITLAGKKPVTIKDVGVRLKGQASRYDVKFPMKIKFDAFVTGQKFLGLKRLTLNNMVQDASFIHEVTAYKLYRAAGVPAPRASYSQVSVDGNYFGVYLNLESIDTVFAKRWYRSTKHIYSGPYNCDIVPGNTCYEASIGDTDRTDLAVAGAVAALHGEDWWNTINQVADMPRVIKLMATDIFMSNWDGYTDAVQNNHFVHFDDTGKLTIIPWGLDQTFTQDQSAELRWDASQPVFRGWSDHRSTLLDHCIEYVPCHTALIREGINVSKMATSVKLADYKNLVAAKINPIISGNPDFHWQSQASLQSQQSWIDTFIPQRQLALTNFLASSSPRPINMTLPTLIRAGQTIKAAPQAIWEPGVSATFQWRLDGNDIPNANSLTHHVLDSEIGHELTITATLTKTNVSATTQSVTKTVLGRLLKLIPTPKITGQPVSGKTLRVSAGKWDSGTRLTYQWLRDGIEISGATATNYPLTSQDVGHLITVKVTGTKSNYAEATKTAKATGRVR
jgi:hypothetical protein